MMQASKLAERLDDRYSVTETDDLSPLPPDMQAHVSELRAIIDRLPSCVEAKEHVLDRMKAACVEYSAVAKAVENFLVKAEESEFKKEHLKDPSVELRRQQVSTPVLNYNFVVTILACLFHNFM